MINICRTKCLVKMVCTLHGLFTYFVLNHLLTQNTVTSTVYVSELTSCDLILSDNQIKAESQNHIF